jgi:hypothetical protein
MVRGFVIDELNRILKEVVMALLEYIPIFTARD